MPSTSAVRTVRTKFLVISDAKTCEASLEHLTTEKVDVAIHCGNLTTGSTLAEFRKVIAFLSKLNAPLKLIVAGNQDFTLDTPIFHRALAEEWQFLDYRFVKKEYGNFGSARRLFDDATDNGIMLLDQGAHHFELDNGASLTVYASPYTLSENPGDWAFQYPRSEGHIFDIPSVDVVMTHGPPREIFDFTLERERAGCRDLFAAVARARPRMHCFGHVPEQWGARLVTWHKKSPTREPCFVGDLDHPKSIIIEKLGCLKKDKYGYQDFYRTDHCAGEQHPLKWEAQTLFVNAAIGGRDRKIQPAWVVDIELSKAFKG